jgi:hypothetical protein
LYDGAMCASDSSITTVPLYGRRLKRESRASLGGLLLPARLPGQGGEAVPPAHQHPEHGSKDQDNSENDGSIAVGNVEELER